MKNLKIILIILNFITFIVIYISYESINQVEDKIFDNKNIGKIHQVEILNSDYNITLVKEDFNWTLKNPINWQVNNYSISNFINVYSHLIFSKLFSLDEIQQRGEIIKDYGINKNSNKLVLYYENSKIEIKIGNSTRDEKSFYCIVNNEKNLDSHIWIVSKEINKIMNLPINEWTDTTLIRSDLYEIDDITASFRSNNNSTTKTSLHKKDGKWYFIEPFSAKANDDEVRYVINNLLSEKIYDFCENNEISKKEKNIKDNWEMKFEINSSNNNHIFYFSESNVKEPLSFRYCITNYSSHLLKIKESFFSNFSDWTTKLRERNIFQIEVNKLNRISITNKNNKFEIIKKDENTWYTKTKTNEIQLADAENVNFLLQNLNSIEIKEFISFNPNPDELSSFGDFDSNYNITTYYNDTTTKTVIVNKNKNKASLWKSFVVEDSLLCLVDDDLSEIINKMQFELKNRNLITDLNITNIDIFDLETNSSINDDENLNLIKIKEIISDFYVQSYVDNNGQNDGTWNEGDWVPWRYKIEIQGKSILSKKEINRTIFISDILGANKQLGKFDNKNLIFNLPLDLINQLRKVDDD